jgi:PadR family transcriptional regulator, regulatory protein PadR
MKSLNFDVSNLSKNFNEVIILSVLGEANRHGYEIALEIEERSNGAFKLNHGTLYPILHKLEKEGLIEGYWQSGQGKRKRKYYTITTNGNQYLAAQTAAWKKFHGQLFTIIGEKSE